MKPTISFDPHKDITSTNPLINVQLPVGTHVFDLFVEDSAGGVSDPVTIVVVVEPDPGTMAIVKQFAPKQLMPGSSINPFTIKGVRLDPKGEKLTEEYTVEFQQFDDRKVDKAIVGEIKSNSNDETMQLSVKVDSDAVEGQRRLLIKKKDGTTFLETTGIKVKA
jgi:hypothetical protein